MTKIIKRTHGRGRTIATAQENARRRQEDPYVRQTFDGNGKLLTEERATEDEYCRYLRSLKR